MCTCAINPDKTRTSTLCRVHAEQDPCLTFAQVTGKRRKGTIRRGVCTNCGWQGPLVRLIDKAYSSKEI